MNQRLDLENRAKAFVHYYFSLFEMQQSSPDPLLNLFAEGDFEILGPGLHVTDRHEAAARIGSFTREARHAHDVMDIQVRTVSNELSEVSVRQSYASRGEQGDFQARARYDMELVEQGGILPVLRRSRISDIEPEATRAFKRTREKNLASFLAHYWLALENEHCREYARYELVLAPHCEIRIGNRPTTMNREGFQDLLKSMTFAESVPPVEKIIATRGDNGLDISWSRGMKNGKGLHEYRWKARDRGANFPALVEMTLSDV